MCSTPGRATVSGDSGVYADSSGATRTMLASSDGSQPGDPDKLARLVADVLAADEVPLHLPVGADGVDAVLAHTDAVRADVEAWAQRARVTALED